MISVEVKYTKDGNPVEDREISRIYVVSETEHAVILSVETEVKYPQPELYSSCSVRFRTISGNYADVKINGLPFDALIIAQPGRYQLYVIAFHDVENDARQVYDEKEA